MKYKILLSAYACEPNKGSEPNVGWKWATELLLQGHEVYVITRSNNKFIIESEIKKKKLKGINFIYYDLPKLIIKIIKGKSNKFSYLYFYLWQIGIYFKLRDFVKKIKFDYIHHVTFVSYRFPSFLCLYDIPFIFGPLSGGDTVPKNIRKSFRFNDKIKELIRDISNYLIPIFPILNLNFKKAYKIIVNSEATKSNIPRIYHKKTILDLAISIDEKQINSNQIINFNKEIFNFCFIGSYEHIKGINIILKILKKLKNNNYIFFFNFIGSGPLEGYIKEYLKKNNIEKFSKIYPNIPHKKVFDIMLQNHLLLFPALRDSGGLVVLEAMSAGLPSAVLSLGGPSKLVNDNCGIIVDPNDKDEDDIVDEFYIKIEDLMKNRDKLKKMSKNCLDNVKLFSMKNKVNKIYDKK